MAMNYHGVSITQSEIVKHVYGDIYNWTASGNTIAKALNGWKGFKVVSYKHKSTQSLVDNLVSSGPLIIGTEEHAYLLTHIYFTRDLYGNLDPLKVILINPKTAKEEVRNWSDFFPSINTIVSVLR